MATFCSSIFLCSRSVHVTDLLSPGAESDLVMIEGCDDHDSERNSPLIDDMEEALGADSSTLLEVGHGELGDFHDPDPDESNRIIRWGFTF